MWFREINPPRKTRKRKITMDDYLEELLASHEEEQTLIVELEDEPSHIDDAIEI